MSIINDLSPFSHRPSVIPFDQVATPNPIDAIYARTIAQNTEVPPYQADIAAAAIDKLIAREHAADTLATRRSAMQADAIVPDRVEVNIVDPQPDGVQVKTLELDDEGVREIAPTAAELAESTAPITMLLAADIKPAIRRRIERAVLAQALVEAMQARQRSREALREQIAEAERVPAFSRPELRFVKNALRLHIRNPSNPVDQVQAREVYGEYVEASTLKRLPPRLRHWAGNLAVASVALVGKLQLH